MAGSRLAELAERGDLSAVRQHLLRRATRIGKILATVRDVKQVERAGLMYSRVTNGLASGFLFRNTVDPTAGIRFRF